MSTIVGTVISIIKRVYNRIFNNNCSNIINGDTTNDFNTDTWPMPIHIAISGKMGHGKDTLAMIMADEIMKRLAGTHPKFLSFATKLKQVTSILTGIPYNTINTREGKSLPVHYYSGHRSIMTVGALLQNLGDLLRQSIDPDIWIKAMFSDVDNDADHYHSTIITDLRYPNEYNHCRDRGYVLVRIIRPDVDDNTIVDTNGRDSNHISEVALDDHDWDYTFYNTGTIDDLREEVKKRLSDIMNLSIKRSIKIHAFRGLE